MNGATTPRRLAWHWPAKLAASFLVVSLIAKCLALALRTLDGATVGAFSGWGYLTPFAMFYQDFLASVCLFVAGWLITEVCAGRHRLPWIGKAIQLTLYAAGTAYVAANVPAVRQLGTPLTGPMLEAASGELWDSVAVHLTPVNLFAIGIVLLTAGIVLLTAIAMPWILSGPRSGEVVATHGGRPGPGWRLLAGLAGLFLVLGPGTARQLAGPGTHRNAVLTWLARPLTAFAPPNHADGVAVDLGAEGDATDLRRFAGAAKGWNVVWVVLESTGARTLKPYGASVDPMPNVTRLAERSVLFEQAYAVYPESVRSLFAILCGEVPGAYLPPEAYAEDRHPCTAVADVFKAAGYRTALFHSGRFVYLGMQSAIRDRGFDVLADAGDIGGRFVSSFGTDEPSTVAKILDFVDAGAPQGSEGSSPPGSPFFIMYLNVAGHHPYQAPGEGPRPFGEESDLTRYQSDLFMGDAAIGTLIDGIRIRGLADRTLWIVQGDHGEAFYQHEGNFAHSLYIFEENVHVPLLVGLPGKIDQPVRAPQVVSTVQVPALVLTLAGLTVPPTQAGPSPLDPVPGVARFFTDHTTWQLGLRQDHWKYILEPNTGREQLYDLAGDADERHNLMLRSERGVTPGLSLLGELGTGEVALRRMAERAGRYRADLLAWSERAREGILGASDSGLRPLNYGLRLRNFGLSQRIHGWKRNGAR